MKQIIHSLDPTIIYLNHEIREETLTIYRKIDRSESYCPYCRNKSSRVHSSYKRTISDLSISIYRIFSRIFCYFTLNS